MTQDFKTAPAAPAPPPLPRIGLIGAMGWIGRAIGRGLLDMPGFGPEGLSVLTRNGPPDGPEGRYLDSPQVHWARSPQELVARSEVVIVSVRPQDWPGLALRAPGRLVISVMAMVPIAELARSGGRIVRAMPNALAEVGRSYTPWVAGPGVTRADRQVVAAILSRLGSVEPLDHEAQLEVMSVLPGAGPAYPALMAAALLEFARAQNLPEAVARRAVQAVISDGSAALRDRIETAGDVVAAFRDYAGVTAAGLTAADRAGFTSALHAGLNAALRASRGTDPGAPGGALRSARQRL